MRLFILKIEGVGMRNVGSNPSARQKTFLKLSIPLARISGTRIIGSMALPFFFYPTPLIFLHSPIFPNNLPSRERYTTWKVSSFAGRQGLRLSGWHQHLQYFIRSEEHTSELQSPIDISYAVFCL